MTDSLALRRNVWFVIVMCELAFSPIHCCWQHCMDVYAESVCLFVFLQHQLNDDGMCLGTCSSDVSYSDMCF